MKRMKSPLALLLVALVGCNGEVNTQSSTTGSGGGKPTGAGGGKTTGSGGGQTTGAD